MSLSKPDQWKIDEIGQAFDKAGQGTVYIELPKFQRSLVWSEEQKRMLIDSLYRGYPIGAVLAYQTGRMEGTRTVVQIVDGLQRTSTISEYLKEPLTFAPVDLVFSDEIVKLISRNAGLGLHSDQLEKVLKVLETWMRKAKIAQMSATYSVQKLTDHLANELGVDKQVFDGIQDDLNNELGLAITRVSKINGLAVPVVLYSGDEGNIPTIFERVNNQGTKLSKYEVLASTWTNANTLIENKDIRDCVTARYQVLIDGGYEIDGYTPGVPLKPEEFNLYEYLFGFGRLINEKYPLLFGDAGDADESVPLAFVLVTTAMGMKLSKLSSLYSVVKSKPNLNSRGLVNLSKVENAILKSVEEINKALEPFLSLKLNKKAGDSVLAHSQNQILSLISAYLVNRFDNETWNERSDLSASKKIKDAAAGHYLFDMVAKKWRGSGDSRLFEMTWQGDEGLSPSDYYTSKISREILINALIDWHEETLGKTQKQRANVPVIAQAVLLFLCSKLVSVHAHHSTDFELEHIYPVSVIGERIEELHDEGWPISALGNLMLLPKPLNRIKGKNTLGDYLPGLPVEEQLSNSDMESISNYLVTPSYLEITKDSLTDKAFYLEFCQTRMKAIAEQIAANLGL